MHDQLIKIHIIANIFFTITAILLIWSASKAIIKKLDYKRKNLALEYSYIGLLYFGLLIGTILYFFVDGSDELANKNIEELRTYYNTRFWAIEHFCVMIFALLIAQIGKIFTKKAINDLHKFRFALFYYGASTLVVLMSMLTYLYHKFLA